MKRAFTPLLIALFLLATATGNLRAALSDYGFSESSSEPTNMDKAETLISPGSDNDNVSTDPRKIGFTFTFNGREYNAFSVSSNGLLGLGDERVQEGAGANLSEVKTVPILTAFWDDFVPTGNGVTYRLDGKEGTRVLTVQWQTYLRYAREEAPEKPDYTFQIRLYEETGRIEFVYGGMQTEFSTKANGMIGLADKGKEGIDHASILPGTKEDKTAISYEKEFQVNLNERRIASNTMYMFDGCSKELKITGYPDQGGTEGMKSGDVLLEKMQVTRGDNAVYMPFSNEIGLACKPHALSYRISGANAGDYTIEPGDATVGTGDVITPIIIFTPGGIGRREATLSVTDDQGFSRTYTLAAQGLTRINWTGNLSQGGTSQMRDGDILFSGFSIDRLSSIVYRPLELMNIGSNPDALPANVTFTIIDPSGQYTLVTPTSDELAAGEQSIPQIRFAPTGVGIQEATLVVNADGEIRRFTLKAFSNAPGADFYVDNVKIDGATGLFTNVTTCSGEFATTQRITVNSIGSEDFILNGFKAFRTDTVYRQGTPYYQIVRDRAGNPVEIADYFISEQPGVAPLAANKRMVFPITIPAGQSRTFYITYIGQEPGKRFGRGYFYSNGETFSSADPNGVETLGLLRFELFGRSASSQLSDNLDKQSLKTMIFQETRVGDSVEMTYQLFNSGHCDLRISLERLAISSGDVRDFRLLSAFGRPIVEGVPMTGDAILAPGASGSVTVRFVPQRGGSRRATIWLRTNDSAAFVNGVAERGAYYLDLYGYGKAFLDYTDLKLRPAVIGTGVASTGTVRLVNSSTVGIDIATIELVEGDFLQFSEYAAGGAWPVTPHVLLAGGELLLGVQMLPTGDPGARATTLRVTTASGEVVNVAITGEAGSRGLSVSTNTMFTGVVLTEGLEMRQVLMITNTGTLPLRLNAPVISGAGAGEYRLGAFPRLILEPNAVEYLEVTFAPTTTGQATAELTISSDGGTEVVMLQGESGRNKPVDDPSAILPGRGGAGQPEITLNMGSTSSVREAAAAAAGVAFDVVRPNPARERAELVYHLSRGGDVRLELYDATGRLVRELASGTKGAGEHRVTVDVSELGAGVYHCRLATGGVEVSRNLVVVK